MGHSHHSVDGIHHVGARIAILLAVSAAAPAGCCGRIGRVSPQKIAENMANGILCDAIANINNLSPHAIDCFMTISIITATLDGDAALEHALKSVDCQTYPDIEHVVVSGESERAAATVARYPKVKLLTREPRGVYDALNFGVRNTHGEVFGFVHGNDALSSPDVIETIAREFKADPDLDFVYGDLRYVRPRTYHPLRLYSAARFKPSQLLGGVCPPHPTLYIRRNTAERMGEYNESFGQAADYEMWVRLFKDKSLKYKYIDKVMVNMTTGGLSTSLSARLYTNNITKLKSLRYHGYPANPFRLLLKYVLVVRDLFI
jgi:glycosyltransferase involved in cell wall biosynthesis